jgi:hypothetical protein
MAARRLPVKLRITFIPQGGKTATKTRMEIIHGR